MSRDDHKFEPKDKIIVEIPPVEEAPKEEVTVSVASIAEEKPVEVAHVPDVPVEIAPGTVIVSETKQT